MDFFVRVVGTPRPEELVLACGDPGKHSRRSGEAGFWCSSPSYGPGRQYHITTSEFEYVVLGDVIPEPEFAEDTEHYLTHVLADFEPATLRGMRGLFYVIQISRRECAIGVYTSLFNLLPIYYHKDGDTIRVASRVDTIIDDKPSLFKINGKYLIEQVLFNYSLRDDTLVRGVRSVPSNGFLVIRDAQVETRRHTDMRSYYTDAPRPWKHALHELKDCFLDIADQYLPREKYAVAFTGGFDSRTLVACSLYHGRDFAAFSFGTPDSTDIRIPQSIARHSGLFAYKPILLDETYVRDAFHDAARDVIMGSEGRASVTRAHYAYAAQKLGADYRYVVTGNCGSEILRALHVTGALATNELVSVFREEDEDALIRQLRSADALAVLAPDVIAANMDAVVEEVRGLRKQRDRSLTLNQNFYLFIFEEMFRKYFGAEVQMQARYVINRMPFLDFTFLRELLQTELAGANGRFFDHSPVRRFRGQALYAWIIQEASPPLSRYGTGKGYRPIDLVRPWGKIALVGSWMRKRFYKGWDVTDPYAVSAGLNRCQHHFQEGDWPPDVFDPRAVRRLLDRIGDPAETGYLAGHVLTLGILLRDYTECLARS